MIYDRNKAVTYAHKWAFNRNPKYYNYDSLGGDCTNFASQCLFAGCGIMNYAKDFGWYYVSSNNRAAAWTGVEYLYNFLVSNSSTGPYASELPLKYAQTGDIIQLSFDGNKFAHSPFIVSTGEIPNADNILLAAHTFDTDNRPLNTYFFQTCRLLHIEGVRG